MSGFSGRKDVYSSHILSIGRAENEVFATKRKLDVALNNELRGFNSEYKMSDAKVSPVVGQEVWAAVSVVFCVAVILVFFFILCCAYRRHRRVRDLTMFTSPALNELGSHSTPWLVSNTKDEPANKWTSGV